MRLCAVVDGCSTGRHLPAYLARSGYRCLHVRSAPRLPAAAKGTFQRADYAGELVYEGDVGPLADALRRAGAEFAIPGSEPGVELADELGQALGGAPNEPGCGRRCRDKALTGDRLRARGVRCLRQRRVSSAEEAVAWARAEGRWPVVVKPLDSGGGDGFFICPDEAALARAVAADLGALTLFGKVNREVLVQEYATGTEYVVNTVSRGGRHFLHSLLVYEKRRLADGRLVYDTMSLLRLEDCPRAEELIGYTFSVLDALGLRNGAAHNEVIVDAAGPVLMECNARVAGHDEDQALMAGCLGRSHAELTALSYAEPDAFLALAARPYAPRRYMALVCLISDSEGVVEGVEGLDALARLPSYHSHRLFHRPGDAIARTVDAPTSPGDVYLCSEERARILADVPEVRAIERRGIFKVRGSHGSSD